jgi:predicted Ser/Thr protein kinase
MPGERTQTTVNDVIQSICEDVRQDFIMKKRVLSFHEYLELCSNNPHRQARTAAQYLVDCFNYFGKNGDRFCLFDCPFEDGKDALLGQEQPQNEIYRIISRFARQGKVDRLILLFGPNGSSKSTIIQCIQKALEFYSSTDEGALYRFSFVFPSERVAKKSLGFGTGDEKPAYQTFAFLDEHEIESKIQSDFKDHPLFLLPKKQRRKFLEALAFPKDFRLSDAFLDGDLSPMMRQVFDTLLCAYGGDLEKVFRHVQVERFFLSRRFRRGIVTIEPQLQVDAGMRQITLSRSLESLPKVLQNLTLFEPYGDLVDGNRGLVEYNDLLKRPIEAFKYILATCEKSVVALPQTLLYLDMVFIASTNDKYLDAFKGLADWQSFKARIELVRVPYLLDYTKESKIYQTQIKEETVGKHIAPHTMEVAGIFSVLTRLQRPSPDTYPHPLRSAISRLSPLEKADLYALGRAPEWAPVEVATELCSLVLKMLEEGASRRPYEGETGASPREIKAILLDTALTSDYPCLSPVAVFAGLEALIKEKTLYEFLRVEPQGEYQDHKRLIEALKNRYIEWADRDVCDAMGLAEHTRYEDVIEKYILHAKEFLRGQKVRNPITGQLEDPDTKFLHDIEAMMGVDREAHEFRSQVIGKIGAWSLDHPGERVPYARLFQNMYVALKEAFFKKHAQTIKRLCTLTLSYLAEEPLTLTQTEQQKIEAIILSFQNAGYCKNCTKEVLNLVLKTRYGSV